MNHPSQATLHDIQSGALLAQISLVGTPIRADELISASGQLQGFAILSDLRLLQTAWLNQEILLLRVGSTQQQVKIMTFPPDGENQGHLDIIPGTQEYYQGAAQSQRTTRIRQRLAILQAILSS